MSRQKLSEYKAKRLLVPEYHGVALQLATVKKDCESLDEHTQYVIKVDQGVKKRGKQGLIRLDVTKQDAEKAVHELAGKGFNRFIADPMFAHKDDEEKYVSFERTREGIRVLFSPTGGISVEDEPEAVQTYTPDNAPLPSAFMQHVIEVMNRQHFSFLEINPLVIRGDECVVLDAAVLVDSAGEYVADWNDEDTIDARKLANSEVAVAELNDNSPAAFSFRILNKDGAIWLLLSGGGASITIADEAMNQGKANSIANYGEYSGGPSTEDTYLYTKQVLAQMPLSHAQKKALVIAGGVANFTDVKKTFKGVIQALEEVKDELVRAKVKVYVRRGGPNEAEGLGMMRKFLEAHNLYGSVHGSDIVLTDVVNEALEYVDA